MKPVKLFCGYEWSLTRFPGTVEALEAESIFNAKVKEQGLTSTWSVGRAEVWGMPIERPRKELFEKWREEAIGEASGFNMDDFCKGPGSEEKNDDFTAD